MKACQLTYRLSLFLYGLFCYMAPLYANETCVLSSDNYEIVRLMATSELKAIECCADQPCNTYALCHNHRTALIELLYKLYYHAWQNGIVVDEASQASEIECNTTTRVGDSSITGLLTQTGGDVIINDDAVDAIVKIGTGSANKTVTIGSASGTSTLTLHAGTGALNVGTANVNGQIVNIGTGATAMNAKTVMIGSIGASSATTIQSGTGNITLSTVNGSINVAGGGDTSTTTVNVGTGNVGQTVMLGTTTGTVTKAVTVGSTTASSVTTINAGTGHLALTAKGGIINIASAATDTTTAVNIATSGDVNAAVTIGKVTGATPVMINSGNAGLSLRAGGGAAINIAGSGDTVTGPVNIGTGGPARTVTVGNTAAGSMTNIQSGNGVTGLSLSTVGGGIINLAGDADTSTTAINLATGAVTQVVTVGANASMEHPKILRVGSNMYTTIEILGSFTGSVRVLGNAEQINGHSLINTDDNAFNVWIGTGNATKIVTIGSTNTGSTTTLQAGTLPGALTLAPSTMNTNADAIKLSAAMGGITLAPGTQVTIAGALTQTGAAMINAGSSTFGTTIGNTMSDTVSIDAASNKMINIGTANNTSSLNLGTTGVHPITIGSTAGGNIILAAAMTKSIEIGRNATNASAATTINIGRQGSTSSGGTQIINIGTADGGTQPAQITLGNAVSGTTVNVTGATTINSALSFPIDGAVSAPAIAAGQATAGSTPAFNGATANCSSITNNGNGTYTITFNPAFSTIYGAFATITGSGNANATTGITIVSNSQINVFTYNNGNFANNLPFSFVVYGHK